MPLSFSRLSTFEQCETKFEHLYVRKSVVDAGGVASIYGDRVHKQLEDYGRAKISGAPITDVTEITKHMGLVDVILKQPGEKYFEHQMALTKDKSACGWMDKDVWLRAIADVLVVNGDKAMVVDWKTGKVKDNPLQLRLFAAVVFEQYPEVQRVSTMFVWLAHNHVTELIFERHMLADMWNTILPRMLAVQSAVDLGVYKSKPSGLCNYCPAKDICPDRRR